MRDHLTDSKNLADYRIAGMNLGWELPGTFNVEIQLKDLSLKALTQNGPRSAQPAISSTTAAASSNATPSASEANFPYITWAASIAGFHLAPAS